MIVYLARAIQAFVMYCVNGTSRSSLLIESTDSMIQGRVILILFINLVSMNFCYIQITIIGGHLDFAITRLYSTGRREGGREARMKGEKGEEDVRGRSQAHLDVLVMSLSATPWGVSGPEKTNLLTSFLVAVSLFWSRGASHDCHMTKSKYRMHD